MYARDHPECGYRQGMHELLAPMYYVVHTESTAFGAMVAEHTSDALAARAAVQEMRVILDPRYIEHDSYALFAALMNNAEEFFLQSKVPIAPTLTPTQAAAERAAQEQLTPVVTRCRKIHHVLLKQKDPVLYAHLQQCHIEPQLYAMRWLRLLFGREFHLQDLLVLWDAIFAYGRSLALADYIAVAMLIYIREQLLQMDEVTAMKRLLKYPPVEDITLFITKAMELCTPGKVQSAEQLAGTPAADTSSSSPSAGAGAAAAAAAPSGASHQPQQHQPQPQQHRNVFDMLAQAMASTAIKVQSKGNATQQQQQHQQQQGPRRITLAEAEANAAELAKLRPRIAALEDERRHSCARLERVIYSLQEELQKTFVVFLFISSLSNSLQRAFTFVTVAKQTFSCRKRDDCERLGRDQAASRRVLGHCGPCCRAHSCATVTVSLTPLFATRLNLSTHTTRVMMCLFFFFFSLEPQQQQRKKDVIEREKKGR